MLTGHPSVIFYVMPDMRKTRSDSTNDLHSPVQFLKGVGPQRAVLLEKLGLRTVADLLFFFPRDYQNFHQLVDIADLQEETAASVVGTVVDSQEWTTRNGTFVFAVLIEHQNHVMRGIWFNQRYMRNRFADGVQFTDDSDQCQVPRQNSR